jgi:hypothetical protein
VNDLGPAVFPDGTLAPWCLRALRRRHQRKDYPVAHCSRCKDNWPCDAARLLEALDAAGDREAILRLNWHGDRDKICAVRALADELGDRSGEGVPAAPLVKVHLPVSDRRIVDPIRRMLLEILEGKP